MIDLTGQTLGSYKIEGLLGVGGMGQVYRGVHVLLNRPAAIKVMHPNLATQGDFRDRFLREAQAVAALSHPNIVEVYEFGEQDDRFYLVMELVMDGSLRSYLQERQEAGTGWSLAAGLGLVRQAGEGLAYAHAKGMVHRDVKPDNLLLKKADQPTSNSATLTPTAPTQIVKVSDFGLARTAEVTMMTLTGVVMGSPAYMSPEQCRGEQLDGRSDQYSLGVVLYEVATGYLPFEAKSVSEAVYKHIYVEPPHPRTIVPDLSEELEGVILRCLAKNRDDRYATTQDAVSALKHVLDSEIEETARLVVPVRRPEEDALGATRLPTTGASHDPPTARPITPTVATITSGVTVPRVFVVDQGGHRLQSVDLTRSGLMVGRDTNNDVVLADDAVSRVHLRLDWDGQRVMVTDRGSSNGTMLAGARLSPHVGQEWRAADWLQVGPYWLRLETPAEVIQDTMAVPPAATAGGTHVAPAPAAPERIHVVLEDAGLTLTPGQPASVKATLANLGRTVDHFALTAEGDLAPWVKGPAREIQLNPGTQATVALSALVPRSPEVLAGDHPVTIRARSRENPDESGTTEATWTVLPFTAGAANLLPRKAHAWRKRRYILGLRNDGNVAGHWSMAGKDDEEYLRYRFPQEAIALDPGVTVSVPMIVQAPWRLIGRTQTHSFTAEAQQEGAATPQPVPGEFAHRAILPTWVPIVVPILLVALALLIRALLPDPAINAFVVKPNPVMRGTPVRLAWSVSDAASVKLLSKIPASGVEQPVPVRGHPRKGPKGTTDFTMDVPAQNTVYQLTANGHFWKPAAQASIVVTVVTGTPLPTATPRATATPRLKATTVPVIVHHHPTATPRPPPPPKPSPRPKPAVHNTSPPPPAKPTPTHKPRPTPVPTAKPTAKPRVVPLGYSASDYLGTWTNPSPATVNSPVRVKVFPAPGGALTFLIFTNCQPTDCQSTATVPFHRPPLSGSYSSPQGNVVMQSITLQGSRQQPSMAMYLIHHLKSAPVGVPESITFAKSG
jgi:serine/threonine protein kinase/outer membrane biosynthesis protein TonB